MLKTIRARLMAYYAAALVVLLGGLGAALFLGVRSSLEGNLEQLLRSHLTWLQGTLELEDDGFEFEWHEPEQPGGELDQVVWQVSLPEAGMLERAAQLEAAQAELPRISPVTPEYPNPAFANYSVHGLPGQFKAAEAWLTVGDDRDTAEKGATVRVLGQVAVDRSAVDRTIWMIGRTLLAVLPTIALLAGLGGFILVSRALAPVQTIAATAARIDERNLSERIPARGRDELAQLAQVINHMLDRLEDQFEQQVRFTADASHELRTPLATLRSGLEVALRQSPPGEVEQGLRQCLSTVDSMTRMLERLLVLARTDSRELRAELEEITTSSLAATLRAAYEALPNGATVHTELAQPLSGTVAADLELLRSLAVNLVENALTHAGPKPEVMVRFAEAPGQFIMEVTDNGPGIPPEHRAHLFERFYRVDKARSRERGGAGLGLAICAAAVELHRGTIQYDDAPGGGSRFTVSIPLLTSQDSD